MLRGDVYWVKLDGIGSEQKGVRPCIIIQNNMGNKFSPTTIVVPMTSRQPKKLLPTHLRLDSQVIGEGMNDSVALCEQVRIVDKRRVVTKIGHLPESLMAKVDAKLIASMGIQMPSYA